jgi:hypothetical protein
MISRQSMAACLSEFKTGFILDCSPQDSKKEPRANSARGSKALLQFFTAL